MKRSTMMLMAALPITVFAAACPGRPKADETMTCRQLSPEEERVIVHKGTERAFTGRFVNHHEDGTYTCRRCGANLFPSDAKFDSGSGWPSFDAALPGSVREVPDADGYRTEIVCAKCGAHLGHVFKGEGFTENNVRHCVNSVSLDFISNRGGNMEISELKKDGSGRDAADAAGTTETAYFAGGCFWGVEYYFENEPGVFAAESGYMGGKLLNPSYQDVKTGSTGHAETVRVTFDPRVTSFEKLAKLFMEIHDPTQINGQGPDIGHQYRSAIFFVGDSQRRVAEKLVSELGAKGYRIQTEIVPAATFWPAEDYHQDYYEKTGKQPYCHSRVRRF